MKYPVLILCVLVISDSAAAARTVAAAYGAEGMSAQATLSAACETVKTKAGNALVGMLKAVELTSISTGVCFCSEEGSAWLCKSEAVGYPAHERSEEMEEQSLGEEEG